MRVYQIRNGVIRTLYKDDLPKGKQTVARASNVEPDPAGGWTVQLTDHPLNGAHAGKVIARNVERREDALKAEVDYINTHILGAKGA